MNSEIDYLKQSNFFVSCRLGVLGHTHRSRLYSLMSSSQKDSADAFVEISASTRI